ncbi:MAG: sialate O-acetylesterase [Verrucomicrobiales bacterium]|jgi:sialate O-acetylesterase|nr:sialate O-acetylesterase [Verrucomicrobiales bacterium]
MLQLSGIQTGQVLQRRRGGATVTVSGRATTTGSLTVALRRGSVTVSEWRRRVLRKISRAGDFTVTVSGLPVGGPFTLWFTLADAGAALGPFYVGDVWILAGQSNMQGRARRPPQGEGGPLVRALRLNRRWARAADPLHLLAESPDAAHYAGPPLTAAQIEKLLAAEPRGGGPGVWFGNAMFRADGVPQGLICAAHGGTSMTQWSPKLKKLGGGSLYGSLLRTVSGTGQPVAGVLWYQGENDANPADAPRYTLRMKELVAALRRDLRQPRLPWVIVQLARTTSLADQWSWFAVREQQRTLPLTVRDLAVVAALDLPMDDWIHVGGEGMPVLGRRLALALRALRGDGRLPPDVAAARRLPARGDVPARIEVTLKNIVGGLRVPRAAGGFFIVSAAGAIKRDIFSRVAAVDGRLLLDLAGDFDRAGDRLMYGQELNTDARITDGRDLALPAFGPLAVTG